MSVADCEENIKFMYDNDDRIPKYYINELIADCKKTPLERAEKEVKNEEKRFFEAKARYIHSVNDPNSTDDESIKTMKKLYYEKTEEDFKKAKENLAKLKGVVVTKGGKSKKARKTKKRKSNKKRKTNKKKSRK